MLYCTTINQWITSSLLGIETKTCISSLSFNLMQAILIKEISFQIKTFNIYISNGKSKHLEFIERKHVKTTSELQVSFLLFRSCCCWLQKKKSDLLFTFCVFLICRRIVWVEKRHFKCIKLNHNHNSNVKGSIIIILIIFGPQFFYLTWKQT